MTNRAIAIITALAVTALADAGLKFYAITHWSDKQTASLQPVLDFALHRNPGIAFDIPVPLFIVLPLTLIISLGFARLAYQRSFSNTDQALAVIAAVIGALGNGLDRLVNGFTTDYIILFRTSAINLSDVLILVGIVGVLWYDKHNPSTK